MIRDELRSDPVCADLEFGVGPGGSIYAIRPGKMVHGCLGKAAELAMALASKYEIVD